MELGTVLQLVVAVAMPFICFILYGMAGDVRELRKKIDPVITDQAVQAAELRIIKKQLHLLEEPPA